MTVALRVPKPLIPLCSAIGISCGVTVLLITVFSYLALPMARDLRMTPAEISGAISLHMGLLIFALPAAGMIADRIGARATIIASALLYAGCLWWISTLPPGRLGIYLAFAFAAILGAGASPVTYIRPIVERFEHNRGMALGIALSGVGLAGMVLPHIVEPAVAAQGWRSAVRLLAAIALAAALIGALAAGDMRRKRGAIAGEGNGHSLGEAARTPAFLIMATAFLLFGMALAGVIAQLAQIWDRLGIDALSASGFQLGIGAATIGGRLLGGWLMDRYPANAIGAIFGVIGAAGLLMLAGLPDQRAALIGASLAFGLCMGAESDVASYLVSRFFGLAYFSRIYAMQAAAFMAGAAIGPVSAAILAQALGYSALVVLAAAALLLSALLLALLRAPSSTRVATPST
ncbi:MAG: MFS transporter [Sphingobium sp.]